MKVLITGGMGVIGAEVSRKFVMEGCRPVIYSRHADYSLIADIAEEVDLELGDILDFARLLQAIKKHGITHIVHMAAFVGAVSQANPAHSIQVNVTGTVNVLEAARLFGIKRVVYASAKGVYGPILGEYGHPSFKPVPEDHPKNPMRIYDAAKLMGEHTSRYYQANMGVDVVVVRFATTYGPGKTARHGNKGVTSQIVEYPAAGLPFRLVQGGDQKDDFIYNKDSALGVYLACTAENPKSRCYNIGTGIGLTLKDFTSVLRRRFPDAEIEIGPGLNFFGSAYPSSSVYDISRAQRELGYRPQYDLEAGITDYLDCLKRMKSSNAAKGELK